MTRTHHDSPKKNRFIGAVLAGQTVQATGKENRIPQSTANDIWHKYQKTGSMHCRHRCGQPRKITPRIRRAVVREAKRNRRLPLFEIGKRVTPNISTTSVRNILANEGLHRRKARKVVFLTKSQKQKRKAWAIRYRKWKDEDWERVIWSDECYVYIGDDKGTVYVTRSADEEYDEDCVVPKFKQSSLRIMIWGCIMKNSKGPMVVLEYPGGKGGGMNANRYQEQVLECKLYDYYMERMEKMG
jgi:hypothetical protein